jgi:hypothetical protein
MDFRLRRPILFYAICSALDELVTFRNLYVGGVEFNPRVAWLISVNPLLYPLADSAIVAAAYAVDRLLEKRLDLWLIWATMGLARLLCFAFSLVY